MTLPNDTLPPRESGRPSRSARPAPCALALLTLLAGACQGPAPVNLGTDRLGDRWDCRATADGGWACARNAAVTDRDDGPGLFTTHRELAYRPERAVALLDLPGDYYALQLAVRDSRAALDRFAEMHGLVGLPQVRVARAERVAYALIAGVYRDRDTARQARDSLPDRVGSMRPWIRRLRSLQNAMLRADALTGSPAAHAARVGGPSAR